MATDRLADDLAAVARVPVVPMILEVVCRTTGMGFAAVARVTEERWIACAVRDEVDFGLQPGGELEVKTTICDEIRESGDLVVIDHVALSDTFCRHPTPARYGFQSYISVPIVRHDGQFFGTLCALDAKPARLDNPETIGMFKLFAELIALHLDTRERLAATERTLRDERQSAELREQFIAVLGHDLRDPLASIDASATVLVERNFGREVSHIAGRIKRSASRMAGLIANLADFARGRLGGGLPLLRLSEPELEETLQHVVSELQALWPERIIHSLFALNRPVVCDRGRLAQLLGNLLANALTHGAADTPVEVLAASDDLVFELSVANQGKPIPPDVVGQLFHPFVHASSHSSHAGLGLGLFIASEIARAHHGTIEVASSPAETRFTFRMPASEPAV